MNPGTETCIGRLRVGARRPRCRKLMEYWPRIGMMHAVGSGTVADVVAIELAAAPKTACQSARSDWLRESGDSPRCQAKES